MTKVVWLSVGDVGTAAIADLLENFNEEHGVLKKVAAWFARRPDAHQRKRPKSSRAGCLLCNPHKTNGAKNRSCNHALQERKARQAEKEQRVESRWLLGGPRLWFPGPVISGREFHNRKQLDSRE